MRPSLPPSKLLSGHLMNVIRASWDHVPSKRPSFEQIARDLKKQCIGRSAQSGDAALPAGDIGDSSLSSSLSTSHSSAAATHTTEAIMDTNSAAHTNTRAQSDIQQIANEDMGDEAHSVDEIVQAVIDGARGVSSQSPIASNMYAFRQ